MLSPYVFAFYFHRASAGVRRGTPSLSKTFQKKQKEREAREALRARQERMRKEEAEKRESKRQERIERQKRRLRNELKATSYQKVRPFFCPSPLVIFCVLLKTARTTR